MTTVSALCRRAAVCFMAVVLIVGVFSGVAVKAAEELDAKITVSYDFQEDFDMIFNCKIYSTGNFSNVRLIVDFGGKKTEIKQADFSDTKTGLYRFTFRGVSAAEMTEVAKAKLCANIGNTAYESKTKETSVKSYAMTLLNFYSKSTNDKIRKQCTAIVDMLNYGSAAQVYFGKNTNNLANKDLTAAQKKLASSIDANLSSCLTKTAVSDAKASIEKIALSFENPVDLILYAKFDSAPSSNVKAQVSYTEDTGSAKTLTVASSAFEYNKAEGLYRIEFKDIPSRYLKAALTIVLKDGNTSISSTVSYSCESYVKAILDGKYDDNVKDLVKKMLAYGVSAGAYAATLPAGCVTYRQLGAVGNGAVDDYYAIVMTHDYANAKKLPVKADLSAHYFVKDMDTRSIKGGRILTDTDWGDAKFTIDDRDLDYNKVYDKDGKLVRYDIPEGQCFLFTIDATGAKGDGYKYLDPDTGTYLGIDPNLGNYPNYPSQKESLAKSYINKEFKKGTTKLSGTFNEKALYVIYTQSKLRWGRNGSNTSSAPPRAQNEPIIVNKNGTIDSKSPVQWDWSKINTIYKYTIDETPLTVNGGTFTTIVNNQKLPTYIYRGISITRCNVTVKNVKHYLDKEIDTFDNTSKVEVDRYDTHGNYLRTDVYVYARKCAPTYGFFALDHCAYVTLKDCVMTNHLRAYVKGNNNDSTAPYDFTATNCIAITLDGCKNAKTNKYTPEYIAYKYNNGPVAPLEVDKTGYLDTMRWGTSGTNFCKNIVVNNCALSRIDAHMGVYNMTVKNSTMGHLGILASGFGTLNIEKVTSYSTNFLTFRTDFGSAWYGDVNITDCTWKIRSNYTPMLIKAQYDPSFEYCFEPETINGKTYYCRWAKNININRFTLDASELDTASGGGALYSTAGWGFQMFMPPMPSIKEQFSDTLLNNPAKIKYPLKVPEKINLTDLTVIKHPDYAAPGKKVIVTLRSKNNPPNKYLDYNVFNSTVFNFDPDAVTYKVAGQ